MNAPITFPEKLNFKDKLITPEIIAKSWVITITGKRFNILDPDPDAVELVDIASSLARQARFNGHTKFFYSVGQHSCLGAELAMGNHLNDSKLAAQMLFHDATETYIGDLVSPVKRLLPDFEIIESRLEWAIAKKFNLDFPHPPQVKTIDRRLLATEVRDLITMDLNSWNIELGECFDFPIIPWPVEVTEARFLDLAKKLLSC